MATPTDLQQMFFSFYWNVVVRLATLGAIAKTDALCRPLDMHAAQSNRWPPDSRQSKGWDIEPDD
jgi:hypothetical protein